MSVSIRQHLPNVRTHSLTNAVAPSRPPTPGPRRPTPARHRPPRHRRHGWRPRASLGLCLVAAWLTLGRTAWAGPYLETVAFVLEQAASENEYLRYHLNNPELSRIVHALAAARLESIRALSVPEEVVQAHPHVLLALESYERAADAAQAKHLQRFLVYRERARDETGVLNAVLRHLGFALPAPHDDKRSTPGRPPP